MNVSLLLGARPERSAGCFVALRRNQSGQLLIVAALSISMLIGITALSIDAAYLYNKRNKLHAAADAAAQSAAIEVRRGNTGLDNLRKFANHEVCSRGFLPSTSSDCALGSTTVTMNCPPTSGPLAGGGSCSNYVEVIVSESTPTFFGKVLGWNSSTPGGRAVAGFSVGSNCMVALGPPYSGTNLDLSADAPMTVTNCTLTANGNATINSQVTASVANLSGSSCSGCSGIGTVNLNTPLADDPLAAVPIPSNPGSCIALGAAVTAPAPGCYSSFVADGNRVINLTSGGTYYMTGGFDVKDTTRVNGTNVLIYVAAGQVNIRPAAILDIQGPTSGSYLGLAIYQARNNLTELKFLNMGNNGILSNSRINGIVYAAGATVTLTWEDFSGSAIPGSNCFLMVAKKIRSTDNANGNFDNTCSAFGGSPIRNVSLAE